LEKVHLSGDIDNFVDESSIHNVLDESLKSKVFDMDVNEVDFLGVENILSNFFDVNVLFFFFMRVLYITCLMKALIKVKSLILMLINEFDFLRVENILSNSLDVNVFDDFYAEKNFMFKSEEIVDSFWKILMAHEREKMCDNCVMLEFFNLVRKVFKLTIAVLW